MKIYVARHGETDWNSQNKICGITDRPLTEKGFEQAKLLSEKAKTYGIDVIICSPLTRARQTAEVISESLGLAVTTDERLTEQNYGIYEGLDRSTPQFLAGKRQFCAPHPQGEGMFRLAQRTYNLIDEIKLKYPDKNVLLVCHGGVCRMIRTYFEPMTNEEFANYSPDNCSIVEYDL